MAEIENPPMRLTAGPEPPALSETAKRDFDEALEAAAPKITEMAAQARAMRRAGQTRKFPA